MVKIYSSWSTSPIGKASRWKLVLAKFWFLTHPYISVTPSSSTSGWGFDKTPYGFILWLPGKKHKRCGKRIHISWRMLID